MVGSRMILKVIYASLKRDFGSETKSFDEVENSSWEYHNLYKAWKTLEGSGLCALEEHWFDEHNNAAGFDRLIQMAKQADLIWVAPVTYGLNIPRPQAHQILDMGVPIVSFDPDTHGRFDIPGEHWITGRWRERYVSHFLTPAAHMVPIMEKMGMKVQCMPFGIPGYIDKMYGTEKEYDVGIVGQRHGVRQDIINTIRKAGIRVHTFGHFWDAHEDNHGRVSCEDMNYVINATKVNINPRWISRNPAHGQIKGRDFEILGAGGFMVASQHVESNDLHSLYKPDVDFVEKHYVSEMVESIKYYLDHDKERQAIAYQAYTKREANLWTTRIKTFINEWPDWKLMERLVYE